MQARWRRRRAAVVDDALAVDARERREAM